MAKQIINCGGRAHGKYHESSQTFWDCLKLRYKVNPGFKSKIEKQLNKRNVKSMETTTI